MHPPQENLMTTEPSAETRAQIKVGDVVQINETHGRKGWIGAFVLVTEVKTFGIQGFVHVIETHEVAAQAFIRLNWADIDLIGAAKLVPA